MAIHNLDSEPLFFFGYHNILQKLLEVIIQGHTPVVIRGFGGTGKSTMAKVAAYRLLQEVFGAAAWVDTRRYYETQTIEIAKILDSIAQVYSSDPIANQFGDINTKIKETYEVISQKRSLIIFDNFETVINEPVAKDIFKFICYCHRQNQRRDFANRVQFLFTTRETNRDLEEAEVRPFILKGLDAEDSAKLIKQELRSLYMKTKLDKNAYQRLYELTLGNPKVLKFAIAQLPYLPFSEIVNSLEIHAGSAGSDEIYTDLFKKVWEDVLNQQQKQLLMSITYFVNHAPMEALAKTTGLEMRDAADHLKKLNSLSLLDVTITNDSPLYTVHPLTQRVCETKITHDHDYANESANRFVAYYLDFVRRNYKANPALVKPEIPNIVSAIRVARQLECWDLLIAFRDPVNAVLWFSGEWHERVEANKNILEAARKKQDAQVQARVLVEDLGFTYLRFEELNTAEQYVREGLLLYRALRDEQGIAQATRHLGKAALLKGEYELLEKGKTWEYYFKQSQRLYKQSLESRRKLARQDPKEETAIADLKLDFGRLYWLFGRKCERDGLRESDRSKRDKALGLYHQSVRESSEAIKMFELLSLKRGIAKGYGNLGNTYKQIGIFYWNQSLLSEAKSDFSLAQQFYEESLEIANEIQKTDEIAHASWGLAEIFELYSDLDQGQVDLLEKALHYAKKAYQLYSQMATPGDIRSTRELVDRIQEKLEALNDRPAKARSEAGREKIESGTAGVPPVEETGETKMLEATAIQLVMKAVDFVFDEGHKLLEERRKQKKGKDLPGPSEEKQLAEVQQTELQAITAEKETLIKREIKDKVLQENIQYLRHLMNLKDTYLKKYFLLKEQEALLSPYVPPYIVLQREESEKELIDTVQKLRALLEKIYGASIDIPGWQELD